MTPFDRVMREVHRLPLRRASSPQTFRDVSHQLGEALSRTAFRSWTIGVICGFAVTITGVWIKAWLVSEGIF